MSANRPVRLICRDVSGLDRIQYRQPRFGPAGFGNGRGVSSARAQCGGDADELFVEQHDRSPLGPAGARPLRVYRLNCGSELKSTGTHLLRRLGKVTFRLFNQWTRPLPRVLLRKRNVPAVRPSARPPPRLAVEHESQQTSNLRFRGHLLQEDTAEPDRFLRQAPPSLVDARHVIPADAETGINSFEYSVEALRQLPLLGNLELDAPIADLRLGTHQALAHRRR